jgi:hypothetical protein
MSAGRSDVASDLPRLLAQDAQIAVRALGRPASTNVDASLDYLISKAYKSPDVLLDARDLLGAQDADARAGLYRAARLARHPVEPEPPRPLMRSNSRPHRLGDHGAQRGGDQRALGSRSTGMSPAWN